MESKTTNNFQGVFDIVIPTIRNLDFLEKWRGIFDKQHLIILQDGDPSKKIEVPSGFNCNIYNWNDIDRELGEKSWIIPKKDGGIRCFGFLKAKSKYVYCIDDDCYPVLIDKKKVDILRGHEENLNNNSHPDYFNTLYDGEFVRGYPFGLRVGKPTAISHGLWLNIPDLDSPTQMVKPFLKNKKIVDAVVSIPKGAMYSLSAMNFAFNKDLIGLAMYHGLMGEGWPLSRYDDLFAGWCSKIICDHLGYGVKSGKPYVWHERASNWKSNLKREYNGILWHEELFSFFENVKFSSESDSVEKCYLELADFFQRSLIGIDEYFVKLAEAMRIWVKVWKEKQGDIR